MKNISFILLLAFIASCSTSKVAEKTPEVAANRGLTREVAELRSRTINNVKYDLSFKIGIDDKEFSGREVIAFDMTDNSSGTTIDFQDGQIQSLQINGQKLNPNYNKFFITIPAGALKIGPNTVKIEFAHSYSNVGTGLHRFKDPEDGNTYTFSHFEPFDANRLYPCFDQPDLKANFTLAVNAPADWQVISSTRETGVRNAPEDGRRIWTFPESQKFSTYLISLHAGPYKMWQTYSGKIPLRLFARKAMAKYIPVKDWFTFTKQGLEFYGKYFGYAYPFKKYDQIVAPEFNMGAMENVASVTFSEHYIKRGKPTDDDRENLANTLLHEMAHMWFGDLVTMKWWNGLWLNESFATIMASMCVQEATEFKKSWETFYSSDKQWAYLEDQYVTTHPIEAIVPNTDQAFANFDGITYGKGASVLKQLFFFLGPEATQEGIHNYFTRYEFSNATLNDFIGSLKKSSRKDLTQWKHEWLETAGLNSVEPSYTCNDRKIQNFTLNQSAPAEHPVLRSHSTEVGFFVKDQRGLKLLRSEKVNYAGAKTVFPQFDGGVCPDLVFTNLRDFDYVKEKFDPRTLAFIQSHINAVSDSFLRLMAWNTLWEMVRDANLDVQSYAEMVFNSLGQEKEFKIVDQVLRTVHGKWGDSSVLYYLPKESGFSKQYHSTYVGRLENFVWKILEESLPGSDLQKRWFDAYSKIAQTPDQGQKNLVGLLDGKVKLVGFILDQDRRWNLIRQLNHVNPAVGDTYLQNEKEKDKTNTGFLASISSEAIQPNLDKKETWYKKIVGGDALPLSQARAAMDSMFPSDSPEIREHFTSEFFKDLSLVDKNKGSDFQESFVGSMAPSLCNETSVAQFSNFIKGEPNLSPVLVKGVKIAHQEDGMCLKVRGLALQRLNSLDGSRY